MNPPLRFSVLKQMARSPAHALYAMTHEPPDTAAMRAGRIAHSILLGRNVPTVYEGERRGKVWAEFKSAHEDEDIVTASEFNNAAAMASALNSHSEACRLLLGERERTILFDFAGRACRATPDIFTHDRVVELKTTVDASPTRFPWIAGRLSYASQLVWYADALKTARMADPERLWIVAVESKAPHVVNVFSLTDRAIDFGRRLYRTWIEQLLVCERSNDWPGYPPSQLDAGEEALELVGPDGEAFEID